MDNTAKYRQILTEALEQYAAAGNKTAPEQLAPALPTFDTYLLFDRERDHYQALGLGWHGNRQTCLVIFHFAIQNGKIWLHRNVADYDILEDLERRGIPKSDIVLAFQPPQVRKYTDYAVA